MKVVAIDPGTEQSAFVEWDGQTILQADKWPNSRVLDYCRNLNREATPLFIEMVASYGMPVGREVFETCVWIGRFVEAFQWSLLQRPLTAHRVPRLQVKLHLCQMARAKDSNVRQALIDRFGEKGTKKAPGVTYMLRGDTWQAFALAVYAYDTLTNTRASVKAPATIPATKPQEELLLGR